MSHQLTKNYNNLFFNISIISHNCILGERVDTSIFCSSAIKSNRSILDLTQPHICVTPYTEQIKDIQSENQAIDNVRSIKLNIR